MNAIEKWHEIMKGDSSEAPNKLDDLLHDDVVFYSPVVYTPQKGKEITKLYLSAASGVFSSDKGKEEKKESKFKYIKEVVHGNHACLEFETEMNGVYVNGIDLITWDENDKIIEFKVLVRPLQAVNTLHEQMGRMLDKLK
ncbi:nuclear transport factor 2 family protein [Gammaproteobacteria bacterium]|nr:nuclear transport factor 2 family protein [SAR86 cluster bacterium]MDB3995134.1 nuclear transport factor 2 family protein [Gammaproteobacteria bacterium]MDC0545752.1 nuclear transport factor 2 family protein [Gammaproteobacteria bacterium]MDC1251296.1 nuclear transport factor 2 family protein [Gammaproteobacteria bacterium]|tara:strand:+ start:72 stop:491 length:420 start_codon:yes stop_codon:yes gene_type:complete